MSLVDRARENASEMDQGDWGERLELYPGQSWEGRWRGETSTQSDYGEQRVFLLWERDGTLRFIYGKTRLSRRVDAMGPQEGDNVAIFRETDEAASNGRTIHRYGLAVEPSSEPLPESKVAVSSSSEVIPDDDDIPW